MEGRCRFVAPLALLLLVPVFAEAQIAPINNPQGFSGKATLITFEGQGISGPGTIASLSGVTFSNGPTPYVFIALDDGPRPFGPQESRLVENRTSPSQPITLAFASPMTRLGFEARYNLCDARVSVEFFRGQASVGTAQGPPSPQSQPVGLGAPCAPSGWIFAAFGSAVPFDRVVITAPGGGYHRLDNIRFEYIAPTATITSLANPSSFSSAATLITFEGQGISGPPTVASLSGVTFSHGSNPYVSIGMDDRPRPFGPADPRTVDNRPATSQPISLVFATPATRLAFEASYNGCGATTAIAFFSGATQIGTAQSPPSGTMPGNNCSPGNFVFAGFQSTVPFDRVQLTGPTGGYLRIDNVRFDR